jgi:hypothetical protein
MKHKKREAHVGHGKNPENEPRDFTLVMFKLANLKKVEDCVGDIATTTEINKFNVLFFNSMEERFYVLLAV